MVNSFIQLIVVCFTDLLMFPNAELLDSTPSKGLSFWIENIKVRATSLSIQFFVRLTVALGEAYAKSDEFWGRNFYNSVRGFKSGIEVSKRYTQFWNCYLSYSTYWKMLLAPFVNPGRQYSVRPIICVALNINWPVATSAKGLTRLERFATLY